MKNVLVLTYWSYKNALIQTYTLPYVRIIKKHLPKGSKIHLLTIEQENFSMSESEWNSEVAQLQKEGIELIRIKYDHFGLTMMLRLFNWVFKLKKLVRKENISTLHAWCTPAGGLGYILSKLTGKPLILDSYEPHAEAMVENGSWSKSSLRYKLLMWLEKKQSKRANTAIALTEGMRDYAAKTYRASFNNYHVKPALVDLEKFKWTASEYLSLREAHGLKDRIVCLYAGKLGGIYLKEEVFDFFKMAHLHWGDKLKVLLLTDADKKEVQHMLETREIPLDCVEAKFVPYEQIPAYFKMADFAINPVKPVPTKRYCTSIKDGEYWAAGLPVVITKNISDDSTIIDEHKIGHVLKNLNDQEYTDACLTIDTFIAEGRESVNAKISTIAQQYRCFEIAEEVYKKVYL